MIPPLTLVLSDVQANITKITAKARMMDIGNRSFPNENYTPKRFAGLTR